MAKKSLLEGLDTLEQLLPMCYITKATNFKDAEKLLENQSYDLVILDIMGVDGYKLLEIARKRKMVTVMLTAHALSIEDTEKSFDMGAASYIPKDEMANIATYLNDVLEAQKKGKGFWWRWLERFSPYYEKKFGPDWEKIHGLSEKIRKAQEDQ
ncbi:MAG: response regulator [Deltaproteobacteria bacterium]|nr:response regulator [Deltaproteobacteria bacterium]